MKKLITLAMLCVALAAAPAVAAPTIGNPLASSCDGYTPKQSENLWDLSLRNLNDASLWRAVWKQNPQIKKRPITHVDGKVIVQIYTTDCLHGLTKSGKLLPAAASQGAVPGASVVSPPAPHHFDGLAWFLLFLALAALVNIVWWFYSRHQVNQSPVESGPPVVDGGVTDETATRHFQDLAVAVHRQRTGSVCEPQRFTIVRLTAGRGYGVMSVNYALGTRANRRLNGEPVYRALVRFPDGREEELYMLQACGNDLRYSGISRYVPDGDFRFVPDAVDEPVPAVAEPAATSSTQNAPEVVLPDTQTTEPDPKDGIVEFEFADQEGDEPGMLRVRGMSPQTLFIQQRDHGFTLRFRKPANTKTPSTTQAAE